MVYLPLLLLIEFGAPSFAVEEVKERPAAVLARDTLVPREILERIEAAYAKELKKAANEDKPKHGLLNVAVELVESGEGALTEAGTLALPPGGGALDLAPFVGRARGGFNVKLIARDASGAAVDPGRVFFVSRSKQRRLDGETYGDGCGTFYDFTDAFRSRFAARGFDVHTAEQRYLATLGGTFIFARFDQSSLQVASVTFTDSRYPQFICE